MIAETNLKLAIRAAPDMSRLQRAVTQLAEALALPADDAARVDALATCLGTELLRAPDASNEVLLRALYGQDGQPDGIELLALQAGNDAKLSISAGSAVIAWSMLADTFDVYAQGPCHAGTLVRVFSQRRIPALQPLAAGGVCVAIDESGACGDGWAVRSSPEGFELLVVDGLGHGPHAAAAAQSALRQFDERDRDSALPLFQDLHARLQGGRGAAASHCRVDGDGRLQFEGIGNVAAFFTSPRGDYLGLVPGAGVLGTQMPMPRTASRTQDWPRDSALVMHTDGIRSCVDLMDYRGLLRHDPGLVAAVLYADHARGGDDATVVVVKKREPVP